MGPLEGVTVNGATDLFRGINYALAPTGERRFEPAVLADQPWSGTRGNIRTERRASQTGSQHPLPLICSHRRRPPALPGTLDATAFGHTCYQSYGIGTNVDPSQHPNPEAPPPDEDCLNLNVYRPTAKSDKPRPVMVWVHGGGFCLGSGSEGWHNGTNLALSNDAVIVTLNYRLGPLGFLVRNSSGYGGMNGIHDQIVALKWVQANIAAFGGDAGTVTVFGESSGGNSVCILNASPLAKGLFNTAIISSGPCLARQGDGWGPGTPAFGTSAAKLILDINNVTTLEQLRTLPPTQVQWTDATSNDNSFAGYFMDGWVMTGTRGNTQLLSPSRRFST
jgi:para-nitrobenzyl esterase